MSTGSVGAHNQQLLHLKRTPSKKHIYIHIGGGEFRSCDLRVTEPHGGMRKGESPAKKHKSASVCWVALSDTRTPSLAAPRERGTQRLLPSRLVLSMRRLSYTLFSANGAHTHLTTWTSIVATKARRYTDTGKHKQANKKGDLAPRYRQLKSRTLSAPLTAFTPRTLAAASLGQRERVA